MKNSKRSSWFQVQNNENQQVCSTCGGKCCQNLPGELYPQDVGFDRMTDGEVYQRLVAMFASGKWQVDWWDGYWSEFKNGHEGIYVRPATRRGGQGRVRYGSWGHDGCCFWDSKKGCELPFEQRPFPCKELEPKRKGCLVPMRKDEIHPKLLVIEAWWPYEELISRAADRVEAQREAG